MNIKKCIYAFCAVFLLNGSVALAANVGITLSGVSYDASGTETTKSSGQTNNKSDSGTAPIGSIFVETEADNGVTIGLDVIPYGQKIADGGMTSDDDAETSGTNTVDVKLDKAVTLYAEFPVPIGYLKVGAGLLTIETDETVNTGSTYGDEETETFLIGLGKKGEMDNGMIWKAEALYQRISGTTFNAATGGNAVGDGSVYNKITLDDVDTMQIRFSVAKSF